MVKRRCSTSGCDKAHRARGLCSTHYNQVNKRMLSIPCAECGTLVSKEPTKKYGARFCSYDCRDTQRGSVRNLETSTSTTWIPQLCRIPATHPVALLIAADRREASRPAVEAQMRETRQRADLRRRVRMRDAFVAPVDRDEILRRDKYRCHICRRRVLVDRAVPYPRAATLDHLVPLAQGGLHEPANVSTACFLCNSIKGDRGGNEQLMLIG